MLQGAATIRRVSEAQASGFDVVCYRIVVRGRVQGVGFRWFVIRRANELGVVGWVRNRPDRMSVEALAQGPVNTLNVFIEQTMRVGPGGAFVSEMSVLDEVVDDEREMFWMEATGLE